MHLSELLPINNSYGCNVLSRAAYVNVLHLLNAMHAHARAVDTLETASTLRFQHEQQRATCTCVRPLQDMLKHLGHRLALLLPCLLALIACLLEAACAPLQAQVSCNTRTMACLNAYVPRMGFGCRSCCVRTLHFELPFWTAR